MFPQTLATFDDGVEMMNPYSDGISLSVALAYSPISNLFKKRIGTGIMQFIFHVTFF